MMSRDGLPGRERIRSFADVVIVESQTEARSVAESSRTVAVVRRGIDRAMVYQCPCGCREMTVINLDPATGHAWRHSISPSGISLMPSVWRESGCRSHYIVWRNGVWWCDFDGSSAVGEEWPDEIEEELTAAWRRLRTLGIEKARIPTRSLVESWLSLPDATERIGLHDP